MPEDRLATAPMIAAVQACGRLLPPAMLESAGQVLPQQGWPAALADDLAMLMFSSGSTGEPKGVRLTHRQLLCNLAQLAERSQLRCSDRSLSWLPLTHDMGLVLFHLCHTLAGLAQFKMTPLAFARDPLKLLEHISRHCITVTGMPNFGFDQLARAAARCPQGAWNLGSLRLVYNGAEPIDPELCRRFAAQFAPHGLAPHAISPGWGIAEASVVASAFPHTSLRLREGIPSRWVEAGASLRVGEPVRDGRPGEKASLELAALGPPVRGLEMRVLDDAGHELQAGHLGHLEIRGPNVSAGYYGAADTPWCATGDLGFVDTHGWVYLSGRAKDMLLLNGSNHFSNDIESALCRSLDWPVGQLAVVGVADPVRRIERVVAFFRHARSDGDADARAASLRNALESHLAYPVAAAIALPALPRTSSGKIRRFALRQALLEGEFDAALTAQAAGAWAGTGCPRALDEVERALVEVLRTLPGADLPATAMDPTLPLSRYGLDSVGFMQLAAALGERDHAQYDPAALIEAASLERIAATLSRARPAPPVPMPALALAALSDRQAALHLGRSLELCPGECPERYAEACWLDLEGELDLVRWIAAANEVLPCHPVLRALLQTGAGEAQWVLGSGPSWQLDHCACDGQVLEDMSLAFACQPIDLERGPLLRLRWLDAGIPAGGGSGRRWRLCLLTHHMVLDGWSLRMLLAQCFARAAGAALPTPQAGLWEEPQAPERAADD
jgi:acyl-CoA synthetase (AMP-forming)/AMP-acid ligase II/aryl carrier-like protein